MPQPATVTTAGMFVRDANRTAVPLTGVAIDAEISGLCARVSIAHRYVNHETTPIEAVYVFPMDEGAAVCGFEAVVDGTLVVGEVQERGKAFESYDDAMAQGHGAFLLDEERADVFQASIGNLLPGKSVVVRTTYVTELASERGRLRFTIPTTVSPRYAPPEDHVGVGRPDAEALNPPVAWKVPYGLELSVRIDMPGGVRSVESPTHGISVINDASADAARGQCTVVRLAQQHVALDRDFVLGVEAPGLSQPQAWVERQEDGTEAVAVAFVPSLPASTVPADVVFLVDRSGSMQGTSIEEVRNALQLCLRSMVEGCRFNIVGFGSRFEALFPESRPYNQASLDAASTHVAQMEADLGGTEILPALQFALTAKPAGGFAWPGRSDAPLRREVVVLTDGEVTNTDAVLALAREHAAQARVFTFGIGAGASHHLVRGLARAGGGASEFIAPGERIEQKVVRQFVRLLSPALTGVRLEWQGGAVTTPGEVPPVFAGDRLLVYGLVKGRTPASARLSATGPEGPVSFEVPVAAAPVIAGRTVATLAARALIRELEEGLPWLTRGSRQRDRKSERVRQEIIDLGIRYGLLSRETSYVAVEKRDTPLQADVALRRVPIALTTGWAGLGELRGGVLRAAAPADAYEMTALAALSIEEDSSWWRAQPARRSLADMAGGDTADTVLAHRLSRADDDARARAARFDDLVHLQSADGSWTLTGQLAVALGREFSEIVKSIPFAGGGAEDPGRAWATALALAWLQVHVTGAQDQWRLLAEKGRRWLEQTSAMPSAAERWQEAAMRFLLQDAGR